jgi:hypothetical protein
MLTEHDWFIGYCLLSSEQYFSYIVHGNKYNTTYKNYIEIRDGWVNRTRNIWCHWKNWRGGRSGFEHPMLTNKDWQTIISRTQMYRVWVMVFNFNHISVMWWRSVLLVDETWSSAHKQTNKQTNKQINTHTHTQKQQQKHWNKMISNNYLTVGVD